MTDILPDEHDVIIFGTGMTESILAGALARIGMNVLHLDKNDYYGGDWASFNFRTIFDWIEEEKSKTNSKDILKNSDGNYINIPKKFSNVYDIETICPYDISRIKLNLKSNESILTKLSLQSQIDKNDTTNVDCDNKNEPLILIEPENNKIIFQNSSENEPITLADQQNCRNIEFVNSVDDEIDAKNPNKQEPSYIIANAEVNKSIPEETNLIKDNKSIPEKTNLIKDNKSIPEETNLIEDNKSILKETNLIEENKNNLNVKFDLMVKNWRSFSIDLFPKIMYSRGSMVELLISSDVARYCEFKSVTRILTRIDGKFQKVPCSRSDVFTSTQLSMLDKRMLMKFLTLALDYDMESEEYLNFRDKPFSEFLKYKGLSDSICHFVHYSIAMVSRMDSTDKGLLSTNKFLKSLNRYETMPFLWPMYGSGEMLQSFCRLCAVFGGVYCLRHSLDAFILDQNNHVTEVIDCEKQHLKTKWLVLESSSMPAQFFKQGSSSKKISRAILVTDKSLFVEKNLHISVAVLPSLDVEGNVIIYELSHVTSSCPADCYLVHFMRYGTATAKEDFSQMIAEFFEPISDKKSDASHETMRPQILWSLFFTIDELSLDTDTNIDNLLVAPGPDFSLDCDHSIETAKKMFTKICPNAEFLPKAPDPNDIIFSDD